MTFSLPFTSRFPSALPKTGGSIYATIGGNIPPGKIPPSKKCLPPDFDFLEKEPLIKFLANSLKEKKIILGNNELCLRIIIIIMF